MAEAKKTRAVIWLEIMVNSNSYFILLYISIAQDICAAHFLTNLLFMYTIAFIRCLYNKMKKSQDF